MRELRALQAGTALLQLLRDGRRPVTARREIATRRLLHVLREASRHVPFYRDWSRAARYDPDTDFAGLDDVQRLPVVDKALIRAQYSRFQHEGYVQEELFFDHTSGSSGEPFRISFELRGRALRAAAWVRVLMRNGHTWTDRVLSLTGPTRLEEGRSALQRLGVLPRLALDFNRPAPELADRVLAFRPDVLYGNRCSLDVVAAELLRRGRPVESLKAVVYGGEVIDEATRVLCRKAYGVALRQVYGSVETLTISHDVGDDDGGQHPVYDLSHVEFLDERGRPVPEGVAGRVVVSRLLGVSMPILRYDTGDTAVYRSVAEPDGSAGFRIVKIHGRDNEILTLPDGGRVTWTRFHTTFNTVPAIRQFRVVQEARAFFRVYLAAAEAELGPHLTSIRTKLDAVFHPSACYVIARVDAIPPDRAGKLRTIVPLGSG